MTSENRPRPRGIQHIGVTVPDLEAATTFLVEGLGAKVSYDGLTPQDDPREGPEVERQLGLPAGAAIRRQRFVVIGGGPGLELFEITGEQRAALQLVSQAGLAPVGNVVDTNYTMLAKLPRSVLGDAQAYDGMHARLREIGRAHA